MTLPRTLIETCRICLLLGCLAGTVAAQTADNDGIPRTADGRPDFNGIWQAIGSAHYDIEPHAADFGPPAGNPARLAPSRRGLASWWVGRFPTRRKRAPSSRPTRRIGWRWTRWSNVICPASPAPIICRFRSRSSSRRITWFSPYEFASASRIGYVDQPDFEAPIYTWMGHNLVTFEGDTMVIEVTDQVPDTWFDHAGNHHTEGLRVTERWSHMSRDVLLYEATMEDPAVYTEPWTIRMPLYRRLDENMQLLEFKCVEFTEELLYGHLRRQPEEAEN